MHNFSKKIKLPAGTTEDPWAPSLNRETVSLIYLGLNSQLENSTHLETSPLPVKAANFDPYSALMAIEQGGFLSV